MHNILEKDHWRVGVGGFVSLQMIKDTTQSEPEWLANGPIDRPGTIAGDYGRTQFSARGSRLSLRIDPPSYEEWTSSAYFEGDFAGYAEQPQGAAAGENSLYSSGSFRMRHAYVSAETNDWRVIAGQNWSLFGWNPSYLLQTVTVIAAPGQVFGRIAQLQISRIFNTGSSDRVTLALAVTRPSQRDSDEPNLEIGIGWANPRRSGWFGPPAGMKRLEAMSFAVSGTSRRFRTLDQSGSTSHLTTGMAISANALIPILTSSLESTQGSLVLTGSYASGTGFADDLPGWTGNLARFPVSGGNQTVMDGGQGGFDSADQFRLLPLQVWNVQLQYHFPKQMRSFLAAGYSNVWSSGIGLLGPVATGKVRYDGIEFYFVNINHDITPQIRIALEYSRTREHYVDDVRGRNDRYDVSALFIF